MEMPEIKIDKFKVLSIAIKEEIPYQTFKVVLESTYENCNRETFIDIFKNLGFYIDVCIKKKNIFHVTFTYKEIKEYFDLLFKYGSTCQQLECSNGISEENIDKIKNLISAGKEQEVFEISQKEQITITILNNDNNPTLYFFLPNIPIYIAIKRFGFIQLIINGGEKEFNCKFDSLDEYKLNLSQLKELDSLIGTTGTYDIYIQCRN